MNHDLYISIINELKISHELEMKQVREEANLVAVWCLDSYGYYENLLINDELEKIPEGNVKRALIKQYIEGLDLDNKEGSKLKLVRRRFFEISTDISCHKTLKYIYEQLGGDLCTQEEWDEYMRKHGQKIEIEATMTDDERRLRDKELEKRLQNLLND